MRPSDAPDARELAALGLLLVLVAAIHLFQLDSDPPGAVQRHFVTDEGWWAHDARLHLLLGRWSVDDHDVALVWAPLHTGLLRVWFGAFGEGLVPLRLLSVSAALATCLVLFGFVRGLAGPRAALLATLLFGTHFFAFTHHRIGYPETLQALFVAGAFLSAARAVTRPRWALVAGLSFACALLAKISALWLAAPLACFWGVHALAGRRAGWPPFRWEVPASFAAGVALVGVLVAVLLVWPNREAFEAALARRLSIASGETPLRGLALLGLRHGFPDGELRASGFFRQSPVLLAGLALAVAGGAATRRAVFGSPLGALCLCWLAVGIVVVGTEVHPPDRRFLALTPALCILVALALDRAALAFPARAGGATVYASGAVAAALGVGLAAGLVLRGTPAQWLRGVLDLDAAVASLLAWLAFAGAAVAIVPPLARRLPRRPFAVPAAAFLLVFLAVQLGRIGSAFLDPHYTVRDASERVAALTRAWPAGERAILGDAADTLALGSGRLSFLIRRWEHRGVFMNLDGWERFDPWLVLGDAPERPGFVALPPLELAPGPSGEPRFTIPVYLRAEPGDASGS